MGGGGLLLGGLGGVCSQRGVCSGGGECLLLGGVWSGGCLLPGGVPGQVLPPVDRHTPVNM